MFAVSVFSNLACQVPAETRPRAAGRHVPLLALTLVTVPRECQIVIQYRVDLKVAGKPGVDFSFCSAKFDGMPSSQTATYSVP